MYHLTLDLITSKVGLGWVREGSRLQNGWILQNVFCLIFLNTIVEKRYPEPWNDLFVSNSCTKKPCLQIQNLQYKFLDWKWPPLPSLEFFRKFIIFVRATRPLSTIWFHRINYIQYEYCFGKIVKFLWRLSFFESDAIPMFLGWVVVGHTLPLLLKQLLAPKVLLKDLWPMITIHPLHPLHPFHPLHPMHPIHKASLII